MTITFKKLDTVGDNFAAVDGRFQVTAERTPSGYVREWRVVDTKTGRSSFCANRKAAKEQIENVLRKELSPAQRAAIETEIKMMLHSCRDTMRLRYHDSLLTEADRKKLYMRDDPRLVHFDVRLGDYGEAFGVLRALHVLGYGEFGAVNHEHTLSAWMRRLEEDVLKEEGFGGDGKCSYCFSRYQRDDARPRGDVLIRATLEG